MTGAAKGIMIDASPHVTIDGVTVHDIRDEGVHFRRSSADGIIQNSRIERTGTAQPQYGEGIYLGSANSNWACYGNTGGVDASNRIRVLNNRGHPVRVRTRRPFRSSRGRPSRPVRPAKSRY